MKKTAPSKSVPATEARSSLNLKSPLEAVEVCVSQRAKLGEGAFWDEGTQKLYWVDILSGQLFIYDPTLHRNETINFGQFVTTVVSTLSGGLVLALHREIVRFDLVSRKMSVLAEPEKDLPDNRFNDGKCDPAGRLFWPRWDANYYLDIAARGAYVPGNQEVAFFPLYPMALGLVAKLGFSLVTAGYIVSNVTALAGFLLFTRLCRRDLTPEATRLVMTTIPFFRTEMISSFWLTTR